MSITNERLAGIARGIRTRLSAGASGAPDMDRDLVSALSELLASRLAKQAQAARAAEAIYLRSYLAWAIAQIEVMNDGKELSAGEWDEDAAMFWQAKQMANGVEIEHLLHEEGAAAPSPVGGSVS